MSMKIDEKNKWWSEGVRFQCQGSGKCCLSRGQYGFVYLTLKDRKKIAEFFKIPTREFTEKYCDKDKNGNFHLIEKKMQDNCMFLKGSRCGIYEARPTQCRTWPFWPEVMGAKTWAKEVAAFCPGVGKGPVVPVEKILEQLKEQQVCDDSL
jgi:Fe-S-cluster containining protein